MILPSTLEHAAKAYAKNPKKLGEIVIALATGSSKGMDEGQQVILAMCKAEIAKRDHNRELARDRKRNERARKKGGAK